MNCEAPEFNPLYSAAVRSTDFLSAEEEVRLLNSWKQDRNLQALHKIIMSHNRLVLKMARRRPKMYSLADMVQEGNIGMMQAADKWSPDKGVRFAAYARFWINNSIRTYIKGMAALTMRGKGGHMQIQIAYLSNALKSRNPMMSYEDIVAAIAKQIRTTSDVVAAVINVQTASIFSLDADTYANGDERPDNNDIADACDIEADVSTMIDHDRQKFALSSALQQLDERTRNIVLGRYGIGCKQVTLEYLASEHHLSRERIRQIENKGLRKLKDMLGGSPIMAEGICHE